MAPHTVSPHTPSTVLWCRVADDKTRSHLRVIAMCSGSSLVARQTENTYYRSIADTDVRYTGAVRLTHWLLQRYVYALTSAGGHPFAGDRDRGAPRLYNAAGLGRSRQSAFHFLLGTDFVRYN